MNKICGIYKITSPTDKIYIGQSKDIIKRIETYRNVRCVTQIRLYRSIIKYGWEAHKFEVIHECNGSELNELEKHYIKLYDCFDTPNGLNLTTGGDSPIVSEETKLKIGLASKGRVPYNKNKSLSEKTKEKLSLSHIGLIPHNKGKKTSLEIKQTQSKSHLGNRSKMGSYEIYNQNNELVYKFTGKFINKVKGYGLPTYSFLRSYQKNVKINRSNFKNWYAIKLSKVNLTCENSCSH
jgi:group I intron endonuclease